MDIGENKEVMKVKEVGLLVVVLVFCWKVEVVEGVMEVVRGVRGSM